MACTAGSIWWKDGWMDGWAGMPDFLSGPAMAGVTPEAPKGGWMNN